MEPELPDTPVPVFLDGYLGVRKKASSEERQRYFVLSAGALQYFADKDAHAAGQQPKGTVGLHDVENVEIIEGGFRITLSGDRGLLLSCDSPTADSWVQAITSALAEEPLHQGELAMIQHGKRCTYHFVLHRHELQYFSSRAALESCSPDGCLAIEGVEDLEVEDTHLMVHMNDGRQVRLEETSEGELQGWVEAFGCIFGAESDVLDAEAHGQWRAQEPRRESFQTTADLAGGPTRCVHEGPLLLAEGAQAGVQEQRHVVLYGDKVDFFRSQAESDSGRAPLRSVATDEIRCVCVVDHGLELELCGCDGPLKLLVPEGSDLDAWKGALERVLLADEDCDDDDDDASPGPELCPASLSPTPSTTVPGSRALSGASQPMQRKVEDPRTAHWLASLRGDFPLCYGVLWLQDPVDRRLVPRFGVLFRKHLDSWACPLQAVGRQPPERRIELEKVTGLSFVAGGFVIVYQGRKMGVHVGDAESLEMWSGALRVALNHDLDVQEEDGSPRSGYRIQKGFMVSPGLCRWRPNHDSGHPWTPRVADLQSPRHVRARAKSQDAESPSECQEGNGLGSPKRQNGVPFRSLANKEVAEARRLIFKTDPEDPAGIMSARAYKQASERVQDRIYSPASPLEPHAFKGGPAGKQTLAGKVNSRVTIMKSRDPAGNRPLAEKVSGPSLLASRGPQPPASKITESNPGNRSPRGPAPLSLKVNEMAAANCGPSPRKGMTGKITGGTAACRSPRSDTSHKITGGETYLPSRPDTSHKITGSFAGKTPPPADLPSKITGVATVRPQPVAHPPGKIFGGPSPRSEALGALIVPQVWEPLKAPTAAAARLL